MAHSRTKQMLSVLAAIIVTSIAVVALCLYSAFGPHKHVLVYSEGYDATCTQSGEDAHWHCRICGRNFEDEQALNELATVYIPALQHVFTAYGSDEVYHFRQCVVCKEVSSMEPMEHYLIFDGDEYIHFRECYCGYEDMRGPHVHVHEDDPCEICGYGGLTYKLSLDKRSYVCVGVSDASKHSVVEFIIPDTFEGLPVSGIDEFAFRDCVALRKITFGNNITTVGDRAFINCTALTEVVFNNQLKAIGTNAFWNCTALEELVLPQSVTNISGDAFRDCTSLKKINIPDKVTKIEQRLFSGCTSLTSITLPSSITTIELGAFIASGITELVFPEHLTAIPQTVCYNCESLERVVIPASVKSIATSAFMNCSNLKEIVFLGSEEQWENVKKYINDDENYLPSWNYGVPEDCRIIFEK